MKTYEVIRAVELEIAGIPSVQALQFYRRNKVHGACKNCIFLVGDWVTSKPNHMFLGSPVETINGVYRVSIHGDLTQVEEIFSLAEDISEKFSRKALDNGITFLGAEIGNIFSVEQETRTQLPITIYFKFTKEF